MPTFLHIVNGDAFGDKLRASDIEGEILVWRESLYEGPIGVDLADLSLLSLRSSYMKRKHNIPEEQFKSFTLRQEEALTRLDEYAQVVMWFEHDLFDQLMLCYLLSRLYRLSYRGFSLSLLSIDRFPGIDVFYGLGQLSVQQVKRLHRQWLPVTEAQLVLGHKVWQAYSASEPLPMASIMKENLSPLPYLAKALESNAGRFPSAHNGLSEIQQLVLSLLLAGEMPVLQLFSEVSAMSTTYGLGDLQFWGILDSIRRCPSPLIDLVGGSELPAYGEGLPADFRHWRARITDAGRSVHDQKADHIHLNGIDDWMGGIHLLGDRDVWRRNSEDKGFFRL